MRGFDHWRILGEILTSADALQTRGGAPQRDPKAHDRAYDLKKVHRWHRQISTAGSRPVLNIEYQSASSAALKICNSANTSRAKSTGARPLAVITC